MIKTAMVVAAGRGVRMRHLTTDCPKPLVQIRGKTFLDIILDKLNTYGISNVVINTCYKGDMIKQALIHRQSPRVLFSEEETALETGGGVKKALSLLRPMGDHGFFVINADALWQERSSSLLSQMEKLWNPRHMDILLALVPKRQAFGDAMAGNYFLEDGIPRRQRPGEKNIPYFFIGVQIIHPRIFHQTPTGPFSLRDLYDSAERAGRLRALIYDGDWFHVGTPAAVQEAEFLLKDI